MHTNCISATITHILATIRATHTTKVAHKKINLTQKSYNRCWTFAYNRLMTLEHTHKLRQCSNCVEFNYDSSCTHNKSCTKKNWFHIKSCSQCWTIANMMLMISKTHNAHKLCWCNNYGKFNYNKCHPHNLSCAHRIVVHY